MFLMALACLALNEFEMYRSTEQDWGFEFSKMIELHVRDRNFRSSRPSMLLVFDAISIPLKNLISLMSLLSNLNWIQYPLKYFIQLSSRSFIQLDFVENHSFRTNFRSS